MLQGCESRTLADLDRSAVEKWLNVRKASGSSARTRNVDLIRLDSFMNWCISNRRLAVNPLAGIPKAKEKADPRRKRRALTEDELARLLDAARRRPLRDALAVRRGPRKGVGTSDILPGTRARLELLGRERALIYKTLVLTGLRKAELASLTVAQVHLDTPRPCFELDAKDEKSREGNSIPLRDDLAADLRLRLADLLTVLQGGASRRGASITLPSRRASIRTRNSSTCMEPWTHCPPFPWTDPEPMSTRPLPRMLH